MATPSADLAHCLDAERDALKQCVDMLGRERQLLMDGNIDALADLGVRKSLLLESAAEFSSLRERYLSDNGFPGDRDGMDALLRENPDLHAIWDETMEWARQARILNNVNGALIDVRITHNRSALSVMHQAATSHATYGQDGHILHGARGRTLGRG
ncbi:Flagellar biosynthesis protein flgN [Georgfuchsia toluolica]|uniref:Flagellar biosynthesis protein flgN n=1 Tax=Georgfuchsia toluolica TaxID=424218 RepID=A0A916MYS8_9PROT|nr:flagellar protein FlgN [Georgfuchsia toluolica]CAG4882169.1 Flagellar biosynthesis protein flgN [Georgfuchsia toluolica]